MLSRNGCPHTAKSINKQIIKKYFCTILFFYKENARVNWNFPKVV